MITRPTSQRDQAMLLVSIVAVAGVFLYWYFLHQPKAAELATVSAHIEALDARMVGPARCWRAGRWIPLISKRRRWTRISG